jgi:hypothetical protein
LHRLLASARQDFTNDRAGRKGVRPAGIEGKVRYDFTSLFPGQAVVEGTVEVTS